MEKYVASYRFPTIFSYNVTLCASDLCGNTMQCQFLTPCTTVFNFCIQCDCALCCLVVISRASKYRHPMPWHNITNARPRLAQDLIRIIPVINRHSYFESSTQYVDSLHLPPAQVQQPTQCPGFCALDFSPNYFHNVTLFASQLVLALYAFTRLRTYKQISSYLLSFLLSSLLSITTLHTHLIINNNNIQ